MNLYDLNKQPLQKDFSRLTGHITGGTYTLPWSLKYTSKMLFEMAKFVTPH